MRARSALVPTGALLLSCLAASQVGASEAGDPLHPEAVAVWSASCEFVTHRKVDPIVAWDDEPTDHMHTFAASDDPGPYKKMKPSELRAGAENECESPDLGEIDPSLPYIPDKSSYWTPALTSTNIIPKEWTDPLAILIYYRNAGVDPDTIHAFPQDLAIVAGDAGATLTNKQSRVVMDWSCVAPQVGGGVSNEVEFNKVIPASCPKELVNPTDPTDRSYFRLRLVVYFPNCVNEEAYYRDHFMTKILDEDVSYAEDISSPPGEWTKECKVEGEVPIPQVQVGFRWELNTQMGVKSLLGDSSKWDLTSLKISSDNGADQEDGVSAHTDFMSGWSTSEIDTLMKTCFWSAAKGGIGPNKCGAIAEDTGPWYGQN